jgi:hypothetical protein
MEDWNHELGIMNVTCGILAAFLGQTIEKDRSPFLNSSLPAQSAEVLPMFKLILNKHGLQLAVTAVSEELPPVTLVTISS